MKCLWGLHVPVIQSNKKAEMWSMWWNVLKFFRFAKSFLFLCFSDSWEENNWAEKHALLSPSAGHRGAVIWFTVILPHHHRAAHHHRDPAGTHMHIHTYLYTALSQSCTHSQHFCELCYIVKLRLPVYDFNLYYMVYNIIILILIIIL